MAAPSLGIRAGAVRTAAPWAAAAALASLATGILAGAAPRVPLDVGIALGAAALTVWEPYAALLVVLALVMRRPNEPENIFAAFVAFAGVGLAVLAFGRAHVPRRAAIPLLLFLVISLPSLRWTPAADDPHGTIMGVPLIAVQASGPLSSQLAEWATLGGLLAAFCLAAWAVRTEGRLRTLQLVIVLSALYPIADALLQYARGDLKVRPGQSEAFAAVKGPFQHPNYFAFYLVIVMTLVLVMLLEARRVAVRLVLGALFAAAAACLFLTYTRSAWIGLVLVVLVLGVIRYRVLLAAALVLFPVAAFAFPGSARKVEQRFGDRTSRSAASSENSWEWRTREWRHLLPYGWKKPFFGQGFGRYERLTVKEFGLTNTDFPLYANPRGQVEGFSAHNDYVKTFVETGLVGLALWVLWLIGLLVTAVRASRAPPARELGGALVAIVVAVIVMSGSDNLEGYPFILLMVAVLVGGATGVTARYERERLSARPPAG